MRPPPGGRMFFQACQFGHASSGVPVRACQFGHARIAAMTDALSTAIGARALSRLRTLPACAALLDDAPAAQAVERVALASDFAIETLLRQPERLSELLAGASPLPPPVLAP